MKDQYQAQLAPSIVPGKNEENIATAFYLQVERVYLTGLRLLLNTASYTVHYTKPINLEHQVLESLLPFKRNFHLFC